MSKGKKKMEIYGSDIRGGVLHEGGSLNGRKLPIVSPVPGNVETTRNPHFFVQRREIHRDIDDFCIMCSFESACYRGE
jgi:hypothetical protein